jgi:hypothetical protein
MSWIEQVSDRPTSEIASQLGYEVRRGPSASSCKCPACGVERRHRKSRDRRGSVGMPHKHPGWQCFTCDASGDCIDFASFHIGGGRFRDLDEQRKSEVKAFFGFADDYRVLPALRRPEFREKPLAMENADANYPSLGEVETLWDACMPVDSHASAVAYLQHRDIRISTLVEHDCVRVLPDFAACPSWARFKGQDWSRTRHQLIVPLYDWMGQLRSVLARSVDFAPQVKSVGAVGHGRRGLVMAGSYGREVLFTGAAAHWHRLERLRVSVFEGEIDAMRAIGRGEDVELDEDYRPAAYRVVFGIFSGSFTRDVASRIPSGSTVVLATDDDEQGDKYAEDIEREIGTRCAYERLRPANDAVVGVP